MKETGPSKRPNIVFVFADQLRVQACNIDGNEAIPTPEMQRIAESGIEFTLAVSNCPVCTPYRASLLTGQYPLTTGLFVNDVRLPEESVSIANVLKDNGYDTAYIGKWHLDGPNRLGFTPPGPRRQGFDYWAVGNCTHDYMHSIYYRDDPKPLFWDGYDTIAQTEDACQYLRSRKTDDDPFCLFLSWGTPHNPYRRVPQEYLDRAEKIDFPIRPNCPEPDRSELVGYYAHILALDECLGKISNELERLEMTEDTIFVFTSDHGDMLRSQGVERKQWPWEESIHVPFILRYPKLNRAGEKVTSPFNCPDIMPTLLGLSGLTIPNTVEGIDFSPLLSRSAPAGVGLRHSSRCLLKRGSSFLASFPRENEEMNPPESALIVSIAPFCENCDPPWRGVRTERYTYVKRKEGPWLLYDNLKDPYQMNNLVDSKEMSDIRNHLEGELASWLERTGDEFLAPEEYLKLYNITDVDQKGAVRYNNRLGSESVDG